MILNVQRIMALYRNMSPTLKTIDHLKNLNVKISQRNCTLVSSVIGQWSDSCLVCPKTGIFPLLHCRAIWLQIAPIRQQSIVIPEYHPGRR